MRAYSAFVAAIYLPSMRPYASRIKSLPILPTPTICAEPVFGYHTLFPELQFQAIIHVVKIVQIHHALSFVRVLSVSPQRPIFTVTRTTRNTRSKLTKHNNKTGTLFSTLDSHPAQVLLDVSRCYPPLQTQFNTITTLVSIRCFIISDCQTTPSKNRLT